MIHQHQLAGLIQRSQAFQQAIIEHANQFEEPDDRRLNLVLQAGDLTIGHSVAALALIADEFIPSGIALLRVQFESLVTGIWLLHAASDSWVEKLAEPLTHDAAKRANEGLGMTEMLKELESHPSSPRHIVQQLQQYKAVTWKAMCSFVHSGIHPLSRGQAGYPVQLIHDVVRNANAISALNLQLITLSTHPHCMPIVRVLHEQFSDILPIIDIPTARPTHECQK